MSSIPTVWSFGREVFSKLSLDNLQKSSEKDSNTNEPEKATECPNTTGGTFASESKQSENSRQISLQPPSQIDDGCIENISVDSGNDSIKNRVNQLEGMLKDNDIAAQCLSTQVTKLESRNLVLETQISAMTSQVTELTRVIDENKRKLSDMNQLEMKLAEVSASLRDKEMVCLRSTLQLEAIEGTLADQRHTNADLSFRISEYQKELLHYEKKCLSDNLDIVRLTKEVKEKDNSLSIKLIEFDNLQRKYDELEGSIETANKLSTYDKVAMDNELERVRTEFEVERKKRAEEFEMTLERTKHELVSESQHKLEDYKLRAQGALRTANEQVSNLLAEKSELESVIQNLRSELDHMRTSLSVELNNKNELMNELEAVQRAVKENTSNLENIISQSLLHMNDMNAMKNTDLPIESDSHKKDSTSESTVSSPRDVEEAMFTANQPLFYVEELHNQVLQLRKELSLSHNRENDLQQTLAQERHSKAKLILRVEQLENSQRRLLQQNSGENSKAVNTEYLKNCIVKFMGSNDVSERQRLFPVISTIMDFTAEERSYIQSKTGIMNKSIETIPIDVSWTNLSTYANSLFSK